MRSFFLFAFALMLAGQGKSYRWSCTGVSELMSLRVALALNIVIGGSVGNVTANNFLTVQDSTLTNEVRHSGGPHLDLN
jgi:hypothetical protein